MRDLCDVHTRFPSLTPRLEKYTAENGAVQQLVTLAGTIPISYRGASYNIPINIWVMSYHPSGPPTIYVKPTANMDVKERHDHVDRNGLVYLPYLANWNVQHSTILGAIGAMSAVFSKQPPVYSKAKQGGGRSSAQAERAALVRTLTARAQKRFREVSEEGSNDIAGLLDRRDKAGDDRGLAPEKQRLLEERIAKTEAIAKLGEEQKQLEGYIEAHRVRDGDIDVDTMIHPRDLHSEQVLECLSKDAAYLDALDQLMEACDSKKIDVNMFTKETKRIAREQFYARALLRKVQLQKAKGGGGHQRQPA